MTNIFSVLFSSWVKIVTEMDVVGFVLVVIAVVSFFLSIIYIVNKAMDNRVFSDLENLIMFIIFGLLTLGILQPLLYFLVLIVVLSLWSNYVIKDN